MSDTNSEILDLLVQREVLKMAGWRFVRKNKTGLHLLEKSL